MTNKEAIKYLQQLYPNGGHCWLDEQRIEAIGIAIHALQEEPVSEDLEQAIDTYLATYFGGEKEKQDWPYLKKMAIHFAEWQKQQIMKDSVLCGVDGWFINNKRNCRKNGRFYKYYESTITHDKPLPMENGKDYRLITIKED